MTRVENILEEDVEEKEDCLNISIDKKPGNEEEQHFRKKVAIAKMWRDKEHENITFEDDENTYGLRFDASSVMPNGEVMVFEAGELNCRSRDIVDRLRRSYDAGAEIVLWWPKKPIHELSNYIIPLTYENREHQVKEEGCTLFIQPYPVQPNLYTEVKGDLIMIDLKHLFEPYIWHQDHQNLVE